MDSRTQNPHSEAASEADALPPELVQFDQGAAPEVPATELAEQLADAAEGVAAGLAEPEAVATEIAADPEPTPTATDDASEAEASEPVPELTEEDAAALARVVFSLLFASPDPLSVGRLKDLTESPAAHVRTALEVLALQLESSGLPLVLKEIAGGHRLFSSPEVAAIVQRLAKVRKAEKVTPAALETLAIVAYRQPTTKAEVEAIRGVQAGPMLRTLIDRGLVKVAGRADQPGSPLLYATTRDFLDRFGLASLKELPRDNELAR